jgi:iron complex outermembrane receptor protein/outer membrane receptor for ferrienterochelin and colicins
MDKNKIAIFALASVYCTSVLAEEKGWKENELQIFHLGEIVVTAQREASPAVSVYEVTATEIAAKNAQTVAEALDFVPGVSVTVGEKNEPKVMLRGFEQGKVLVLLDGVPIANPYYGYVDLGQIPVENIAKIKVIKGPVSPLYGTGALGGVINIITKQPGQKPRLELGSSFSNGHTGHYAVNYGTRTDEFSLWLSGSHRRSDGFRLSEAFKPASNEDGGLRENSDYEKNSLSLKLISRPDEKPNTVLSLLYLDNQAGVPPISDAKARYWRFAAWKRWTVALANESRLTDALSVKGRAFYDKYDNVLESYSDATYNTVDWTSTYDDYALGSSLYFDFSPGNVHSLRAGINLKRNIHKGQKDKAEPWKSYEIGTYSLGIEGQFRPGKKVFALTGVSYNFCETYRPRTGGDIQTCDWLLAVTYSYRPELSFYGSLSRKTLFPTMHQLYSSESGNPGLKEQSNLDYELGGSYIFKERLRGELCYFHNQIKNLIDRAERGKPYLNTQQVTIKGLEADLYAKLGEYLSISLAYTYLDARDRKSELLGRSDDELPWTPQHKSDFGFHYSTNSGFSGSLFGSYIGRRYYYDKSNIQHCLSGYWLGRAKISQRIGERWEGTLSVDNLFDVNYQEEEGYPQPGRTVWLGLKLNWEKNKSATTPPRH